MIHEIGKLKIQRKSSPHGGCWFCETVIENFYMYYSREFDSYYHVDCLIHALRNKEDEEAQIIKNEHTFLTGGILCR